MVLWYIPSTPGSVIVHRAYSDLNIVCKKGEKSGNTLVKSTTKGMTFGNIVFGGIIENITYYVHTVLDLQTFRTG